MTAKHDPMKAIALALYDLNHKELCNRPAAWPGDEDGFEKPLSDEARSGYRQALDDIRKAILGDKEELTKAAIDLFCYKPGFFPSTPVDGDDREDWSDVPFFSEAYLYSLMGKQEARAVLGHVNYLVACSEVNRDLVRALVNRRLDDEEKELARIAAEQERRGQRQRDLKAAQEDPAKKIPVLVRLTWHSPNPTAFDVKVMSWVGKHTFMQTAENLLARATASERDLFTEAIKKGSEYREALPAAEVATYGYSVALWATVNIGEPNIERLTFEEWSVKRPDGVRHG